MIKINIFIILLIISVITSAKEEQSNKRDIKQQKNSNNQTSGKLGIFIQYCTSCSYKNSFESIESALLENFGDKIDVIGEPYPLGQSKQALIYLLTGIQYGFIIALVVFDKKFSEKSNLWATYVSPKKIKAGFLCYVLCNFLVQQLSSTGAFEIFINDQIIHSKILSGAMPSIELLVKQVQSKL